MHRLLPLRLAQLARHRMQPLQHLAGGAVQPQPGFGEPQRAVQALEQRHAEPLLERGDLPADRRLRQRQLVAGAR